MCFGDYLRVVPFTYGIVFDINEVKPKNNDYEKN